VVDTACCAAAIEGATWHALFHCHVKKQSMCQAVWTGVQAVSWVMLW